MPKQDIIKSIEIFFRKEVQNGKKLQFYEVVLNQLEFFNDFNIKVGLNCCKEIILQEETGLELGGVNKNSFSLIYPSLELAPIQHGRISLLGHEIIDISDSPIDFGIMIVIKCNQLSQKIWDSMRQFSFISNGIEGFLIRSIPRKFWCRISKDVMKKRFSFKFLGNAITYLYKQRFPKIIQSIEIIFINSYSDSMTKFIEITSEIAQYIKERWLRKIDEWKKRVN